jgi:hypothetical protein
MRKLHKLRWIYLLLLWIAVVFVAGCSTKEIQLANDEKTVSFKPVESITGVIETWIITPHPGEPRSDFAVFAVDLNHGQITARNSQAPRGKLPMGASISDCKGTSKSPDKNQELASIPYCEETFQSPDKKLEFSYKPISGRENGTPVSFRVTGVGGKEVLAAQLEEGLRIAVIDWSADSSAIAILVEREIYGKGVGDILSAASGHPVPYVSFGLRVYSLNSGAQLSIPTVVKDIPYAQGYVHWKSSGSDVLER